VVDFGRPFNEEPIEVVCNSLAPSGRSGRPDNVSAMKLTYPITRRFPGSHVPIGMESLMAVPIWIERLLQAPTKASRKCRPR
jgi:hypothetical protein